MQLTLIVPELVWPEPDDRQTLDAVAAPGLNALLARSRRTRRPPQSLEATLADAFGQPVGTPYGAFRVLGETLAAQLAVEDACWVCADPVHLRFHQERIILADSGSIGVELAEAQALAGELNRHFGDVGTFHVASADRWYLQLAGTTRLGEFDVPPLSAVAGRRVERQLPETAQTGWLRKLLNEAQMVMHGHAVNAERQASGRPPINSLWLWGAGALPPRGDSTQDGASSGMFDGVWSTQPLALGLARAAGIPTHVVPRDLDTLLAHAAPGTHHLVVLDELLGPVHYEDGDAYAAALNALETRWFAPLRKALARGRVTRLRLEASTAYALLAWDSGRADQWKLWQRPQTPAALAHDLAQGER